MSEKHVFDKETDAEKVAMEIVAFLRKWGMWQDVQIFTGGKCYTDEEGELLIREEAHPEKYTEGPCGYDCSGKLMWRDFSNPERLLDMTFEGPLSLLLRHHEYEVKLEDVSEEVRKMIVPETDDFLDEVAERMEEYLEGKYSWDPAEYDSYEEWLELHQYCDMDVFTPSINTPKGENLDFASREEYEDYLMYAATEREARIEEDFEIDLLDAGFDGVPSTFYDKGRIANRILNEFGKLLEKYGLWYDLGFEWSLTTNRI